MDRIRKRFERAKIAGGKSEAATATAPLPPVQPAGVSAPVAELVGNIATTDPPPHKWREDTRSVLRRGFWGWGSRFASSWGE